MLLPRNQPRVLSSCMPKGQKEVYRDHTTTLVPLLAPRCHHPHSNVSEGGGKVPPHEPHAVQLCVCHLLFTRAALCQKDKTRLLLQQPHMCPSCCQHDDATMRPQQRLTISQARGRLATSKCPVHVQMCLPSRSFTVRQGEQPHTALLVWSPCQYDAIHTSLAKRTTPQNADAQSRSIPPPQPSSQAKQNDAPGSKK